MRLILQLSFQVHHRFYWAFVGRHIILTVLITIESIIRDFNRLRFHSLLDVFLDKLANISLFEFIRFPTWIFRIMAFESIRLFTLFIGNRIRNHWSHLFNRFIVRINKIRCLRIYSWFKLLTLLAKCWHFFFHINKLSDFFVLLSKFIFKAILVFEISHELVDSQLNDSSIPWVPIEHQLF